MFRLPLVALSGLALVACSSSTPPMAGTDPGAVSAKSMDQIARERGGAGSAAVSQGTPMLSGGDSGHPSVQRMDQGAGTLGGGAAPMPLTPQSHSKSN